MRDGTFTFYTIQHRTTHKSPWLKPEGKLSKAKGCEDEKWSFSSWDHFGPSLDPWTKGATSRPRFSDAHEETHNVWANTGYHGWWTLKYAVQALRRIRTADAKGKYDTRDGYRNHCQAVRHEFRIVKLTVSKQTEEVSCDDLMDALVA